MFAKFINGPFEGDVRSIPDDVFEIHCRSVSFVQGVEIQWVLYRYVGSECNGDVRLFALKGVSEELVLTTKDRKFLKSLHIAVD